MFFSHWTFLLIAQGQWLAMHLYGTDHLTLSQCASYKPIELFLLKRILLLLKLHRPGFLAPLPAVIVHVLQAYLNSTAFNYIYFLSEQVIEVTIGTLIITLSRSIHHYNFWPKMNGFLTSGYYNKRVMRGSCDEGHWSKMFILFLFLHRYHFQH